MFLMKPIPVILRLLNLNPLLLQQINRSNIEDMRYLTLPDFILLMIFLKIDILMIKLIFMTIRSFDILLMFHCKISI